MGEFVARNM